MENSIIRGTTPTIEIIFSTVDVANITVAVLTFDIGGTTIFEKELAAATLGTSSLIWTLEQAETLSLTANRTAAVICTWLTSGGTRGQSKTLYMTVTDTPINEVMGDATGSY